ncbi:polysaccharide deacetylase family protein [Mycobacterium sp. NAZ190054]|uniref:polysaccharide deacetylase family protein n=1 Tax=Mycobacterium sp. NAZ190054 TaxID=1747766 RepID=UPI000799C437|nr:polysaccharide deacetylase family protein [Mycobacterium sp. NAZ190054]KWX57530.1 polysaccharide deacetylase [Mycobacterium sp. NAZ190054]
MVRRWVVWVAIVMAILVFAGAGGVYQLMNARTFQLAGRLVDRVATEDRVVALTFDDGPTDRTPEVLAMLSAAGVRATFYLNGRDLQRYPQHGRAIAAAGHELGNHTYSHRRMVLVSPATVADEVERTDAEIRATGYSEPITFRPPYGKKLWTLPHYLAEHDRTTVMWDVEPDSADTADANAMVTAAVDAVRPGSIVLLHVMAESRGASRAAVPGLIAELRGRGYEFVTVSELLQRN